MIEFVSLEDGRFALVFTPDTLPVEIANPFEKSLGTGFRLNPDGSREVLMPFSFSSISCPKPATKALLQAGLSSGPFLSRRCGVPICQHGCRQAS